MFIVNENPALRLDKDGDRTIVASGKPNPLGIDLGKKGTVWNYQRTGENEWTIYNKNTETAPPLWEPPIDEPSPLPPPPPQPTPTPAPTASQTAVVDGEAFYMTRDKVPLGVTLGWNKFGGHVTTKNAPAGFVTDTIIGLYRPGMFLFDASSPSKKKISDDVLALGRAVDGFTVGFANPNGKTNIFTAAEMTGYTQFENLKQSLENDTYNWSGVTKTLRYFAIDMVSAVRGTEIEVTAKVKNISGKRLMDVKFMRFADPDQDMKFNTVNRITATGALTAELPGRNYNYFLESSDSRAFASFGGFVAINPYEAKRTSVGTKSISDSTVQLTFDLGHMDPEQEETIVFRYGVRKR